MERRVFLPSQLCNREQRLEIRGTPEIFSKRTLFSIALFGIALWKLYLKIRSSTNFEKAKSNSHLSFNREMEKRTSAFLVIAHRRHEYPAAPQPRRVPTHATASTQNSATQDITGRPRFENSCVPIRRGTGQRTVASESRKGSSRALCSSKGRDPNGTGARRDHSSPKIRSKINDRVVRVCR